LPPLPRQLLEGPFATESADGFLAHPYWAREFLGLGPYRVTGWEPGSFIDAEGFAGHVAGRPKIDRLRILFISNENTALANMLSGEVELAVGSALRVPQLVTLTQEWAPRQGGVVFYLFPIWRGFIVQFLPSLTSPRALLDLRVRRALAHAIDRPALNEAVNAGLGLEADYYLPPNGLWGPEPQQATVKHGYDLPRSQQLMREAGFARNVDGIYASPAEGPFIMEVRAGREAGSELAAVANYWETVGFKVDQRIIPPALQLDAETRFGAPGLFLTSQRATDRTALAPIPGNIPTPDNGWRGGASLTWTDPEYTRLVEQFSTSLDRAQRGEQLTQMARIFSEELAALSLYFLPEGWAAAASLTGPNRVPNEANVLWNTHQWELR
jgi:ABC-type transport system substrate-binding protein